MSPSQRKVFRGRETGVVQVPYKRLEFYVVHKKLRSDRTRKRWTSLEMGFVITGQQQLQSRLHRLWR